MCISAYLVAGRGLEIAEAREFALKSLDRVLNVAWDPSVGLAHVVAYGEGVTPRQQVAGVLEDYGFLGNACLDAWEATGEMRYYNTGRALAEMMAARFYDVKGGGFFDTEQVEGAEAPIARGLLDRRRTG